MPQTPTQDFNPANIRLKTGEGVPYKLVNGYPKINATLDSMGGEEEYIIEQNDLLQLSNELIPRDNTQSKITLPMKMPGLDYLSCVKYEATPVDDSRPGDPYAQDVKAPTKTYGKGLRVHIWYEAISRTFVREKTVGVGAEYLHIPPTSLFQTKTPEASAVGQFTFNPLNPLAGIIGITTSAVEAIANKDNTLGAYKLVPTAEWTYKLQPFAIPSLEYYYKYLGRVNSTRSSSLCDNALVETVLFTGISATQVFSNWNIDPAPYGLTVAPPSWLIELKFSQRCIEDSGLYYTWNHVYSPKQGKWTKLFRGQVNASGKFESSGKGLFDSEDLAKYLLDITNVVE